MLKKLVKYGNSNALILDKAILELLNIEEGATIKIKTDGTSIILTPHTKTSSKKISETFTHNQATIEAMVKEWLKNNPTIDTEKQAKIEKELPKLIKTYQDLVMQLAKNPDFTEEVAKIPGQAIDPSSGYSPEYMKAYKTIRNTFAPEITKLENKFTAYQKSLGSDKNAPALDGLNKKQQDAMQKEFAKIFKKYSNTLKQYGELLNNPEYQHKAQLIAEKYKNDQNSSNYFKTIEELNNSYIPEWVKSQKELKAVSKKYSTLKTK